jgi:hypothetical protein
MNFLKFIVGGLLVLGAMIFGVFLFLGSFFLLIGGGGWSLVIAGVVDFVVLLTGIYLMRSSRH